MSHETDRERGKREGHPGQTLAEYAATRHNVGFLVADLLAARTGARFSRHRRAVAEVAEARLGVGIDAPQLVIVKPLTYMNLVGGPLSALCQFYRIEPSHHPRFEAISITYLRGSFRCTAAAPDCYSHPAPGLITPSG